MLTAEENEFLENIKKENIKALEKMLNLSPNLVNTRYIDGMTAMHIVASTNLINIMELLIDKGAKLDEKDNHGLTAIHFAALGGHIQVLKLLVDKGLQDIRDNKGHTAVHYAAQGGHNEVIKCLNDYGFPLNARGNSGLTAIHFAAGNGHIQVLKLLVDKGLQDIRDNKGHTAVHYAAQGGHNEMIKCLIDYDFPLNARGNSGLTAIHFAAGKGHISTIKFLVENGLKLDEKGNHGRTPIHIAAKNNNIATIEFLIKQNPNLLKATDNSGKTALEYAPNIETKNYLKIKLSELTEVTSINSNINNIPLAKNELKSDSPLTPIKIMQENKDLALKNAPKKENKIKNEAIGQAPKQAISPITTTSFSSLLLKGLNNKNQSLSNVTYIKNEAANLDNQTEKEQIKPLESMSTTVTIKPEPSKLTHVEREQNRKNAPSLDVSNNNRKRG